MADETASIRIQILGGIRAAREAKTVAEALDSLGDEATQVERAAVKASFALRAMRRQLDKIRNKASEAGISISFLSATLFGLRTIAWSVAAIALPALAIALWSAAGAAGTLAVALGGGLLALLGAAGLMALGTTSRFKQMSQVVGSAANQLQNAGYAVRGAFRDATSKGADALMRGLASGLQKLVPLLRQLTPAFTAIGQAMGDAFNSLFGQVGTMGPQLKEMFMQLVPVIRSGADLLGTLLGFLVQIGTVGAPVVAKAFEWLDRVVSGWTLAFTDGKLNSAGQTLRDFGAGVRDFVSAFVAPVKPVFGKAMREFAKAWKTLGPAIGSIAGQLFAALLSVGRVALPLITAGAKWLAANLPSILQWLGDMGTRLFNAVEPMAPFFQNVLWPLLKGLGQGLGIVLNAAIDLLGKLSRAIGWVGEKLAPLSPVFQSFGIVVGGVISGVLKAAGALLDTLEAIKDAIVWVSSHTLGGSVLKPGKKSLASRAFDTVNNAVNPLSLLTGLFSGHASGGTMTRGGMSWVGERGPELVALPKASTVFSNAQSRAIASGDRPARGADQAARAVHHQPIQVLMPNGRVLAETVRTWIQGEGLLAG